MIPSPNAVAQKRKQLFFIEKICFVKKCIHQHQFECRKCAFKLISAAFSSKRISPLSSQAIDLDLKSWTIESRKNKMELLKSLKSLSKIYQWAFLSEMLHGSDYLTVNKTRWWFSSRGFNLCYNVVLDYEHILKKLPWRVYFVNERSCIHH